MSARTPFLPALVVAAGLAVLAPLARAGDVEGVVTLPHKPAKRPPRYGEHDAGADDRITPAIVFVDRVTAGAPFAPPKDKPRMDQRDRKFVPLALPVLVGTTVTFPNGDDEYHNVFSHSKAKELELGRYGKGETKEVTFDKPGVVRLRCEVHSSMHAVIVVLENPWFATTDDRGRFVIKGVPPGKYQVYAFHEDYVPKDRAADPLRAVGREVEIPAEGTARVELNLNER